MGWLFKNLNFKLVMIFLTVTFNFYFKKFYMNFAMFTDEIRNLVLFKRVVPTFYRARTPNNFLYNIKKRTVLKTKYYSY